VKKELRFGFVLLRDCRNERPSRKIGDDAGDRRIDDRCEAEISGHNKPRPKQIEVQGTTDGPKNPDKGQRRRQRSKKADCEFDEGFDRELNVLSDPVRIPTKSARPQRFRADSSVDPRATSRRVFQ